MIIEALTFLGFIDVFLFLLGIFLALSYWIQTQWLNLYLYPKGSFQRELFFKTAKRVADEMHNKKRGW